MTVRSILLAGALVVAAFSACSKLAVKDAYNKQETYIEGFVSAQMKKDTTGTTTLTHKGCAYRLTLHDTLGRDSERQDSLRAGGTAVVWYACYTLRGSSLSISDLVATNDEELADSAGWDLSDKSRYHPDTLRLDGSLVRGLQDGLDGVRIKDECFVLFTGEFGFENRERGTIPAGSALAYHIAIVNIDNEN